MISLVLLALPWGVTAAPRDNDEPQVYARVNLVSDIASVARFADSNLVNPWGLAFGPTTPFWVADNGGNGAPNGGSRHKLFFTAGIADESHGLFGFIKAGRREEEEDDDD